ncbi:hypothetical protein HHX47_DHR8000132 [Lentinula edodes]|nr:hypothetical protein HHX47_DHR8000132 [Lentinula edodes]
MHRVFDNNEILRRILHRHNLSDDKRNPIAPVLVCTQWSEEYLNILWLRLTDLKPLLRLFGQLVVSKGKYKLLQKYKNWPTHAAWLRFEKKYQNRIHRLGPISNDSALDFGPALDVIFRIKSAGPLLPKLHSLKWDGYSGFGLGEPSGNGLANLTVLQIHSTYSAASEIFVGERNLKNITITSHDPASAADIRKLLSRIGQTCTCVEEVKLTFESNSRELIDKSDVVTFEDITPILRCPGMKWFMLSTACPISMDDNDIQKLAESWPSLVSLWLSSRSGRLVLPNRRRLSFKSLIHLAYHCPCLFYASLYIDDPCIPGPENLPVFSSPFNFDVGFSPIENPAEIASFLSKLFPVNFTLWYGVDHFLSEGEHWEDPDLISPNIKGQWSERWATVESFLPQLIQMRLDAEKLKQEVARLKIKCEPRWY